MRRWFKSLTFRLTGILLLGLIAIFVVSAVFQLALQARQAQRHAEINGLALTEGLFGALHSTMLANNRQDLAQAVRQINERSANLRIRIFNKEGEITFSSDPREVGKVLDFEAEACFKCHAQDQPIHRLPPGERTRTFTIDGHRALGIIRPIDNEPACSSAPCHAHPAEKRLLGVLDTTILLTEAEQSRRQTARLVLVSSLAALLIIVIVVVTVVRRAVYRPVRALAETLQSLGHGDYQARYDERQIAEFDELGQALNSTARQLQRANAELTEWAQTLERRVEEKTAQVKQAHDRALHAERLASLGKLAAVVAHEINNPLAGVLTYSKLLRRRIDQRPELLNAWGDSAEILDAIASESKRCGEIVSSLLSFARGTGTRQAHARVKPVVDKVLFLLRHKMELAQIECQLALDGDLPAIKVHPDQLQQAILALCINAIEAMPKGGRLTLHGHAGTDGKGVAIEVSDQGQGVPPEVQERMFEPFFSTKEGEGGLGLGLTVVDSIVQENDGSVAVRSSEGQGTTFVLTFPGVEGA